MSKYKIDTEKLPMSLCVCIYVCLISLVTMPLSIIVLVTGILSFDMGPDLSRVILNVFLISLIIFLCTGFSMSAILYDENGEVREEWRENIN